MDLQQIMHEMPKLADHYEKSGTAKMVINSLVAGHSKIELIEMLALSNISLMSKLKKVTTFKIENSRAITDLGDFNEVSLD